MNFVRLKKGIRLAITCSLVITAVACNKTNNNTSIKDVQGPAETGGGDAMRLNMVGMETDLENMIYERHMLLENITGYFKQFIMTNQSLSVEEEKDFEKYLEQYPEKAKYFKKENVKKLFDSIDHGRALEREARKLNRPLIKKQGACIATVDGVEVEREASAEYEGQICFSIERLAKTTRVTDLRQTIDALLIHELTHKAGIKDEQLAKTAEIFMIFFSSSVSNLDLYNYKSTIQAIENRILEEQSLIRKLEQDYNEYIDRIESINQQAANILMLNKAISTVKDADNTSQVVNELQYIFEEFGLLEDPLNDLKPNEPEYAKTLLFKSLTDDPSLGKASAAEAERNFQLFVLKKITELQVAINAYNQELMDAERPFSDKMREYTNAPYSTENWGHNNALTELSISFREYALINFWPLSYKMIYSGFFYPSMSDHLNQCQHDYYNVFEACDFDFFNYNFTKKYDLTEAKRLHSIATKELIVLHNTMKEKFLMYIAYKLQSGDESVKEGFNDEIIALAEVRQKAIFENNKNPSLFNQLDEIQVSDVLEPIARDATHQDDSSSQNQPECFDHGTLTCVDTPGIAVGNKLKVVKDFTVNFDEKWSYFQNGQEIASKHLLDQEGTSFCAMTISKTQDDIYRISPYKVVSDGRAKVDKTDSLFSINEISWYVDTIFMERNDHTGLVVYCSLIENSDVSRKTGLTSRDKMMKHLRGILEFQ